MRVFRVLIGVFLATAMLFSSSAQSKSEPGDLWPALGSVRVLLRDVEGITIEVLDGKIVIDGELVVPRDLDRILKVEAAYRGKVLNLVSLSRISREATARRIQEKINADPALANVKVVLRNDIFFLEGTVNNEFDRDRAEVLLTTYLPESMSSPAIGEGVLVEPK